MSKSSVAQISFRCSSKMLNTVDAFVASQEGGVTRNQMIEYFINQFILAPVFYDPMDVLVLREPVTEIVVLPIGSEVKVRIETIAEERGESVSAVMRNIIYAGLRGKAYGFYI